MPKTALFLSDHTLKHTYTCSVKKKITISVEDCIYHGLYDRIGAGKISAFIENLVKASYCNLSKPIAEVKLPDAISIFKLSECSNETMHNILLDSLRGELLKLSILMLSNRLFSNSNERFSN